MRGAEDGVWQPASGATEATALASDPDVHLDEDSFRHFAPLLRASQDYSRHSGFRFRRKSFDMSSITGELQGDSSGSGAGCLEAREAAKLRAAPAVHAFAERLRAKEPRLLEELERAFRVVMAESVRNSMLGTCKEMGMFPPHPPPAGVEAGDCAFEDVSAPLAVIAQRLFNDQLRREARVDTDAADGHLGCMLQRRVMTAAYLVDFASEIGVPLPPMSETCQTMLQEFAVSASN